MAEAKSKEKIAKAQLEANYEPSKKAQYNLSTAKAEADYSVDKGKYDTFCRRHQIYLHQRKSAYFW